VSISAIHIFFQTASFLYFPLLLKREEDLGVKRAKIKMIRE